MSMKRILPLTALFCGKTGVKRVYAFFLILDQKQIEPPKRVHIRKQIKHFSTEIFISCKRSLYMGMIS